MCFVACIHNGTIYNDGDWVLMDTCQRNCTCDSGFLAVCQAPQLPGCPLEGCLTDQEAKKFREDFPTCELPCGICHHGEKELTFL